MFVTVYLSTTVMQDALSKIESRKFLPLLYQLAARMSAHALDSDQHSTAFSFQQILQEVIVVIVTQTFKNEPFVVFVTDDLQDCNGPSLSFSLHHTGSQQCLQR